MVDVRFTLHIHFGGKMVEQSPKMYVNEAVATSTVDPKLMSYIELIDFDIR